MRRNSRPATGDVKTRAGRRTIGLPTPLVALLHKHRTEQAAELATAGQLWRDEGWVFATRIGEATNHNTDYRRWKALLKKAGLREAHASTTRGTLPQPFCSSSASPNEQSCR
jgi:integrase